MPEVPAPDFSLQATLSSGQTFRWKPVDGAYYGVIGSAVLQVRQVGGRLHYDASTSTVSPEAVRRYFALELDLNEIVRAIDVDLMIHAALAAHRGLRVLRQEPWEVLASFICASFNHIKRIEGMIERLCQAYGDPVALNGFRSFSFPSAERLAHAPERRLRSLGLGYRAPYLRQTARLVAEGRLPLDQLARVDYDSAKTALLGCDGVGDKVADCVALFGCEHYEAFPVDVWVARAMRYYFRHRRMTRGRVHEYARRHFGAWAGYAQQYLYHAARTARSQPREVARVKRRESSAPV